MGRFLLILMISIHSLCWAATQESLVDEPAPLDVPSNALDILEGEPSAIVAGAVNVITGDYIDFQTDVVVPGVEPLELKRFYCSSNRDHKNFFDEWKFNHMISAWHPGDEESELLVLQESYGAKVLCESQRKKQEKKKKGPLPFKYGSYTYKIKEDLLHKKVTNTSKEMSGKTHLKNRVLHRSIRDNILLAQDGAGN